MIKICTKCKTPKDLNDFYRGKGVDGRIARCKECHHKTAEQYMLKKNHAIGKAGKTSHYHDRLARGVCVKCGTNKPLEGETRCEECRVKSNAHLKEYRIQRKLDAFNAYGGPKCACCGEEHIAFLTIDHIEGGGNKHRKETLSSMGKSGAFTGDRFYIWLKKNGYPSGFQVLCWNCNAGKHFNGGVCPHKKDGVSRLI